MEFIRGRRGPVIFFVRYGIQLLKEYAKPSNPRTTEQQQTRHAFRFVNKLWNFLTFPIFYQIWNNASDILNPHNIFVHTNQNQNSEELNFDNIFVSTGKLEPVNSIGFIKYKDQNGRCMFKWNTTIIGNGLPTDKILLTLIHFKDYLPDQNIFNFDVYINTDKIRADSVGFILPGKELDINYLYGFISTFKNLLLDKNYSSISLGKIVTPF